jgi:hypothetical protein
VPARHLVGGGPAYPPQLSSTPTVHTEGNTCPRRVGGWDSDNNPGSACDPARRRAEKRRALRDVAPTSPVHTLFPRHVTVQDGRHRTALTVPPPEITLPRDPAASSVSLRIVALPAADAASRVNGPLRSVCSVVCPVVRPRVRVCPGSPGVFLPAQIPLCARVSRVSRVC